MSRTFSMNCGSVESLKLSSWCGLRPKARQMRLTALCDMPVCAASERVDQWVASRGASSKVLTSTRSTSASLIVRGAPARGAAHDQRRRRGAGARQGLGGGAAGRDPLVDALAGRADRHVAECRQPHLAGLRPQAAPARELEALERPAVHREGARHRRPLPEPARRRGRALRLREDPGPGPRPHGPDPAPVAGDAGASHARLPPPRHHQPLRRPRRGLRVRDQRSHRAPQIRGVPPLPESHRPQRAGRSRGPRRRRQLLDPQDPAIHRWLLRHPRFAFHFTPTYSSWLSLVERWFAELTERWLRRGTHRSTRELVASIRTWITGWKENPRPFVWHKTSDEILESLASYCERISDSGH